MMKLAIFASAAFLATACAAQIMSTSSSALMTPGPYTVSTVPACNAGARGSLLFVTDALAPVFLTAIVGGGAIITPAFCNGAAWVAH